MSSKPEVKKQNAFLNHRKVYFKSRGLEFEMIRASENTRGIYALQALGSGHYCNIEKITRYGFKWCKSIFGKNCEGYQSFEDIQITGYEL